jgi:hypothetical protein
VVQHGVAPKPRGLPGPGRHAAAGGAARHQGARAQRVLERLKVVDGVGEAHGSGLADGIHATTSPLRGDAVRWQGDRLGCGE